MGNIKAENYIVIPGWAATQLGLKGNDLLLYSIIYGFSQAQLGCFCGSLEYLEEWTQSTRQGVLKSLNKLIDKGLIIKTDGIPTNKYIAVKRSAITTDNLVTEDINSVTPDVNSVTNDSKLSSHNNINDNTIKDKYTIEKESDDLVKTVISYFNQKCGTNFKTTNAASKRCIKARLKEGFSLDDFRRVIDLKYQDWGERPFRFKNGQMSDEFLRPGTLFGDKFESYVYEAIKRETSEGLFGAATSCEVDPDVSDLFF